MELQRIPVPVSKIDVDCNSSTCPLFDVCVCVRACARMCLCVCKDIVSQLLHAVTHVCTHTYLLQEDSDQLARSFIFVSDGALTHKDKLMILIHGAGAVRAGQWSRR